MYGTLPENIRYIKHDDLRIREGFRVNTYESRTVDEDLRPSRALGHQLRPVLQLRVLLFQNLQRKRERLKRVSIGGGVRAK